VDDLLATFDPATATLETLLPAFAELVNRFRVLEQENIGLRAENAALRAENKLLREQLDGKGGPPAWVKPNAALANKKAKEKEQKERKKRTQSFTRHRETPTHSIQHAADNCADCGHSLSGGWEHSRRQIIDVPETPASIIDHIMVARYCGMCNKRCFPKVDLSNEVVGNHRFGVRLMGLIGMLKSSCRLPVRTITALLKSLYGLHVSNGEIINVLNLIAKRAQSYLEDIANQVRAGIYVNADETGWRENGMNGYLWSFSGPFLRYFLYDRSRSGEIPRDFFGNGYTGIIVSDFYGAYNRIGFMNQRCWVHLLRDLKKLGQLYPGDKSVQDWIKRIVALYRKAVLYQRKCLHALTLSCRPSGYNVLQRRAKRRLFESRLAWIAQPYLQEKIKGQQLPFVPQAVLAQRLDRYASELFCFLEYPEVPSHNNAAERAVRPSVIARKICGGTRSQQGSNTYTALASIFSTWKLQNRDLWRTCQQILVTGQVQDLVPQT
jgi:transposase